MEFCLFRVRRRRFAWIYCLGFLCLQTLWPGAPQEALPRPPGSVEPEIKIVARYKDLMGDRLYASGAVEVHYKQVKLFAERVEVNLKTKDVLAEGNVVIQLPDEVTRAETAVFNLDTGRAKIERASGMIQPSILFTAESIERESADLFSLAKARVTACTQPTPRWAFSFSRARLKRDDYVAMWNAVVTIKKIPVFYLPYLRYPLDKERSTGFLMPKLGYSGVKGFEYSQSFYWAIARNMDATVGLDYYLSRGLGVGLEYRYLLSKGTNGDLNLYYLFSKRDSAGVNPGNAASYRLHHIQALPFGFSLVANVDYQTSFDFLREFDNNFSQASISNRSSQVYVTRSWAKFNVSARASLFETYFSEIGDAIRNESLPEINFNVFKVRLFAPLFFSLTGSFKSWQYGWRSQFTARTQRKSSNLSIHPTLSLPFSSIPWMTANASFTGNLAYYGQSYAPGSQQVVATPLFAKNFSLNLDVTGPVFYRVYYGQNGEPKLKNIIEPYLNYTYDSPIPQSDRIVTAYGFFRFHQISYGLTNRFLLKQGDHPVEVLSFNLGQVYYFSPEDGPLRQFLVNGRPPSFSEVTGSVRYFPLAKFSLDASLGYNPYHHNLSSLRITATAGSKPDGRFLSLSWFSSKNAWITGVDPSLLSLYDRRQVNAFAGWRLPGLGLDLQGEVDYNIQQHKVLYTAGQAVCHFQCLDILLELRVFYFREKPDTQFRISLGLGNIGRTADFLGGFGF